MDGWMFGCDVCQDVCPWIRFAKSNTEAAFTPIPEVLNLSLQEWEEMSEDQFRKIFRNSPIKRSKFAGMQRNLKAIKSSDR